MNQSLLEISALNKSFGGIVATRDVNLNITQGEIHAIIGPNGAGKTTLISQLSGQLKPDSGRIYFDSHDITGYNTARRARFGLAQVIPDHQYHPTHNIA